MPKYLRVTKLNMTNCINCNRELKDKTSIKRGFGPECYVSSGLKEMVDCMGAQTRLFVRFNWEIYESYDEITEAFGPQYEIGDPPPECSCGECYPWHRTDLRVFCPLCDCAQIGMAYLENGESEAFQAALVDWNELPQVIAQDFWEKAEQEHSSCEECGLSYWNLEHYDYAGLRFARPTEHGERQHGRRRSTVHGSNTDCYTGRGENDFRH